MEYREARSLFNNLGVTLRANPDKAAKKAFWQGIYTNERSRSAFNTAFSLMREHTRILSGAVDIVPILTPQEVAISDKVIDLRYDHELIDNPGSVVGKNYESACTQYLKNNQDKINGDILLSSRLIKLLLSQGSVVRSIGAPDAMAFRIDPQQNWELSTIYDFKSGKIYPQNIKNKGEKFSRLLSFFSENQTFLPRVIDRGMRNVIVPPSKISIPPHNDIEFHLMSPHIPWSDAQQAFSPFKRGYTTIPVEEAAQLKEYDPMKVIFDRVVHT